MRARFSADGDAAGLDVREPVGGGGLLFVEIVVTAEHRTRGFDVALLLGGEGRRGMLWRALLQQAHLHRGLRRERGHHELLSSTRERTIYRIDLPVGQQIPSPIGLMPIFA